MGEVSYEVDGGAGVGELAPRAQGGRNHLGAPGEGGRGEGGEEGEEEKGEVRGEVKGGV